MNMKRFGGVNRTPVWYISFDHFDLSSSGEVWRELRIIDSNAIAAYKNSGIIFGHVIASTARRLSTILQKEEKLRGYVSSGHHSQYRCSVTIEA